MTRTYHARAFIAWHIEDLSDFGDHAREAAKIYLQHGVTGVSVSFAFGHTAEWGEEETIVVEAFGPVDSGLQDKFYAATRQVLNDWGQQCALLHEEVLVGTGGTQHAYAGLLNADGTRTELT